MTETVSQPTPALLAVISEIAAAYVANNHVSPTDLPALIASIHASVASWTSEMTVQEVTTEPHAELKPTPIQIRRSITPEALISFIDGKPYKMLKRHIAKHGLTPESYRVRFGLPPDYPLTAPSYSSRRSALAKEHQFGIVAGRGTKHRTK